MMTGPPNATPVTENDADEEPAAIVTDAGDTVTSDGLPLEIDTSKPPAGAGVDNATVPLTVRPTPTRGLVNVSEIELGASTDSNAPISAAAPATRVNPSPR